RRRRLRSYRRTRARLSRIEFLEQPLLVGQLPRDDRPAGIEKLEDIRVVDPVEDARPFPPGLDDTDAAERREMLGRRTRVEADFRLQRPDRTLALTQQLKDPHAHRMP